MDVRPHQKHLAWAAFHSFSCGSLVVGLVLFAILGPFVLTLHKAGWYRGEL